VKLLLDEMLDATIAEQLCRRGHDVAATHGNAQLEGKQDPELLRAALELDRALVLGGRGPYVLQAAIASLHTEVPCDWAQIAALYGELTRLTGSPVVELNRAIAIAQRDGPEQGLEEILAIAGRERLSGYPFYAAALGELELRSGRRELAREHFREALALAHNAAEHRFLDQRLKACEEGETSRANYERFWSGVLNSLKEDLEDPLEWGSFFQGPSKGLKQPDNKGGKKPRFRRSLYQRKPI